jgi:hypothetical protein
MRAKTIIIQGARTMRSKWQGDGDPRPALVLALHDKPQVARQFAIGAAKSRLKNAKADRFQSILFDPAYLIRQDGARA